MQLCPFRSISVVGAVVLLKAVTAAGQLTDATQTAPHVPGSSIAKSLDEQVGTGQGDALTPGSSIYLIKRDPARSIRRGRQLFQRKFTAAQGLGPRVNAESIGDIMANPGLGGGLSDSCAACHGRPRGSAGFGGDVVTRPDSRDSPHLFGLGLQEMLADEMTAELRSIRDQAVAAAVGGGVTVTAATSSGHSRHRRDHSRARRGGSGGRDQPEKTQPPPSNGAVRLRLITKGVSFGYITALPDGSVDTSEVDGVDSDLRVRPFFHHGGTISMREFIVGALKVEMGLEAADPLLCAATDPVAAVAITTPSGMVLDPALDALERPPVCDASLDGDTDGVIDEIDPAIIDHLEFYLLNYFKAGTGRQTARTRAGQRLMDRIGCTSCHVQRMVVENDRRVADVETAFDPERGIFNRLFAVAETRFDVIDDGEEYPLIVPTGESFVVDNLYTDFKRHDLGPAFHEREYDGSLRTDFLTEALWGVGSTAPYGHDGRSINLREVILRHGGEAERSRDRFVGLRDREQRMIIEFLQTLVLFPPDDTASNLNPGDPSGHPQDPANHGTINLGALFQIAEEGPE